MENQVTIKSVGMKWGFVLALVSIIFGLLVFIFEIYGNDTALRVASTILLIGALAMAYGEFKKGNEGYMSLGEGFSLGMLILAISSFISNVFTYVYLSFIDDGMIGKIMNDTIIELEEQGLTDEQIDQTMEITEYLMTPVMMALIGFVFSLIFGAIITVIVAAILQKKKPVEL